MYFTKEHAWNFILILIGNVYKLAIFTLRVQGIEKSNSETNSSSKDRPGVPFHSSLILSSLRYL